jgi:hypothetical protein
VTGGNSTDCKSWASAHRERGQAAEAARNMNCWTQASGCLGVPSGPMPHGDAFCQCQGRVQRGGGRHWSVSRASRTVSFACRVAPRLGGRRIMRARRMGDRTRREVRPGGLQVCEIAVRGRFVGALWAFVAGTAGWVFAARCSLPPSPSRCSRGPAGAGGRPVGRGGGSRERWRWRRRWWW